MTRTPVQIVQGFIDRQLEAGNSAKHQLLCNVRDKIKEECMTNEPTELLPPPVCKYCGQPKAIHGELTMSCPIVPRYRPKHRPSPDNAGLVERLEGAVSQYRTGNLIGIRALENDHNVRLTEIIAALSSPIDRDAVIRECARIARDGCLVPPDGGSPTEAEADLCDHISAQILALIE